MRRHPRSGTSKGSRLGYGSLDVFGGGHRRGVQETYSRGIGPSIAARGGTGLVGDEPGILDLSAGPFEFPTALRRGKKLEVEEGAEGAPPVDVLSIRLACRVEEAQLMIGFGFW
jgi:hypothetical protein